jgi:hypothetical protein
LASTQSESSAGRVQRPQRGGAIAMSVDEFKVMCATLQRMKLSNSSAFRDSSSA